MQYFVYARCSAPVTGVTVVNKTDTPSPPASNSLLGKTDSSVGKEKAGVRGEYGKCCAASPGRRLRKLGVEVVGAVCSEATAQASDPADACRPHHTPLELGFIAVSQLGCRAVVMVVFPRGPGRPCRNSIF